MDETWKTKCRTFSPNVKNPLRHHKPPITCSAVFSREHTSEGCYRHHVEISVLQAANNQSLLYDPIQTSFVNKLIPCPTPVKNICVAMNGTVSWMKVRLLNHSFFHQISNQKKAFSTVLLHCCCCFQMWHLAYFHLSFCTTFCVMETTSQFPQNIDMRWWGGVGLAFSSWAIFFEGNRCAKLALYDQLRTSAVCTFLWLGSEWGDQRLCPTKNPEHVALHSLSFVALLACIESPNCTVFKLCHR